MCGIAGFIDLSRSPAENAARLEAMLACIVHRGPDDHGAWVEDGVALGFRRLSIVDLSAAGHQPMISASGRLVMIFNGEIYNYPALRDGLTAAGLVFRGHSDTEVLLELIEREGLEAALSRCVGMFALAVWDRKERVLSVARDRAGEKPLYYAHSGNRFVFASELRAMEAHPDVPREVDREAVAGLLRYGFIPGQHSIYRGVAKLPHAHILRLDFGAAGARDGTGTARLELREYWSHRAAMAAGARQPFRGGFEAACDRLEELLSDAVRMQMQADVPLGAFLSGGIDSSVVVAMMQAHASSPVKTFSIGFDDPTFDEADHARAVAAHLGTEHHEMLVTDREAMDTVPHLPDICDEPFADSSLIPTYHVARIARQYVTVSLSGDGGDELFGGYHKYRLGTRLDRLPARGTLAGLMAWLPTGAIERTAALAGEGARRKFARHRFATVRSLLAAPGDVGLAEALVAMNLAESDLTAPRVEAQRIGLRGANAHAGGRSYLEGAMLLDRDGYLPDDVLVKVDRATMAVSLESRAPLLDHRIIEFAASLPIEFLVQGGVTKRVLRAVLHRRVPKALVERPKMGFSVPLGPWLRSGLREWAGDLIGTAPSLAPGVLDAVACDRLFAAHLTGPRDHSLRLWPVLMYLAWAQRRRT